MEEYNEIAVVFSHIFTSVITIKRWINRVEKANKNRRKNKLPIRRPTFKATVKQPSPLGIWQHLDRDKGSSTLQPLETEQCTSTITARSNYQSYTMGFHLEEILANLHMTPSKGTWLEVSTNEG
jgi:hypothetical protein